MAISVVVVVERVADELCKLLSEKASALKIGPGNEAENEMGPLITNDHKNKVIDYIQQGIDSGAKILLDGREHEMTNKLGFSRPDSVRWRQSRDEYLQRRNIWPSKFGCAQGQRL